MDEKKINTSNCIGMSENFSLKISNLEWMVCAYVLFFELVEKAEE